MAGMTHGTRSEARLRDVSAVKRDELLDKLGKAPAELDLTAAVLIDLLARALSKLQLLDEHFAREGGIIRDDGTPRPPMQVYFTALNSARLTAAKLAEHLDRLGDTRGEALSDYIEQTYVNGNGDRDG
jgi:hypothetical protein